MALWTRDSIDFVMMHVKSVTEKTKKTCYMSEISTRHIFKRSLYYQFINEEKFIRSFVDNIKNKKVSGKH